MLPTRSPGALPAVGSGRSRRRPFWPACRIYWIGTRRLGARSAGRLAQLAIEIARQGYRALVAVNNPVTASCSKWPPSPPPGRFAPGALRIGRRPQRRRTPGDSSPIPLSDPMHQMPATGPGRSLRLERASGALVARIYRCPCGDRGEYPATRRIRRAPPAWPAWTVCTAPACWNAWPRRTIPIAPMPRRPWIVTCHAPPMHSSLSSINWMACR